MYKIEKKNYGLKLTFEGFIQSEEIQEWSKEMVDLLENMPDTFGMLIDMRRLKPLPAESQMAMETVQKLFAKRVQRSATIVDNVITNMQFKRIGKKTGVNQTKIYIDASKSNDWETAGRLWITKAIEPNMESSWSA